MERGEEAAQPQRSIAVKEWNGEKSRGDERPDRARRWPAGGGDRGGACVRAAVTGRRKVRRRQREANRLDLVEANHG
jgi:hypothetical protein